MIIYNVTMKVDWTIAEDWLQWMEDSYIPQLIGTGYFQKHQFVRLLDVDETDGPTYAVQYYAASLKSYDDYAKEFASVFSKQLHAQWGDQCLAFSTLMEIVN